MDTPSVGAAVSQVLAQKQQNRVAEAQVAVLRKTLESGQQSAQQLLRMMGVGQNLDVVG